MKEVAKLQIKDRTELFQATAISMGMQPNVIEKDFWVCFMLDHLFHDCRYKNAFFIIRRYLRQSIYVLV